jgi:polygalacturonase
MGAGLGTFGQYTVVRADSYNLTEDSKVTTNAQVTINKDTNRTTIQAPSNLREAPASITDKSVVLVWEKPEVYSTVTGYNIYIDDKKIGQTDKTYFKVEDLDSNKSYSFVVKAHDANGVESVVSNSIEIKTETTKKVLNVKDFGAAGDGVTKDTEAIQKAIDACKEGETVLLPEGKYLSGALNLHDNMTLYLDKDTQLIPSKDLKDYPWTSARHDIEDIYDTNSPTLGNPAFASLLNAGIMDHTAGANTKGIKIIGEGTIGDENNGLELRKAYDAFCDDTTNNKASHYGGGSLISLKNCSDVYLDGIHIRNGMMWTIVPVYSKDITSYNLDIKTTVHNGDGFDPNSSSNVYILNNTFSTGDDCAAVKSGKDAEGRNIGIPSKDIYFRGCTFTEGHGGITLGSEMSGGISDVYGEDCTIMPVDNKTGAVNPGVRVKVSPSRGGYINNLSLRDSTCNKISVITNYDKQKAATPGVKLPDISQFKFKNITAPSGNSNYILDLNGSNFGQSISYLSNLNFENCSFYQAKLNSCKDVEFKNCKFEKGVTKTNSINVNEIK